MSNDYVRRPTASEETNGVDGVSSVRSVDYKGEPFSDPAPPNYEYASLPVVDHVENRARGGSPDDPVNLDTKTWEANARKGGLEGNYAKDLQNYKDQGLSEAEAKYVLQDEAAYIENDVHARPIDPQALDQLPNQPSETEYEMEAEDANLHQHETVPPELQPLSESKESSMRIQPISPDLPRNPQQQQPEPENPQQQPGTPPEEPKNQPGFSPDDGFDDPRPAAPMPDKDDTFEPPPPSSPPDPPAEPTDGFDDAMTAPPTDVNADVFEDAPDSSVSDAANAAELGADMTTPPTGVDAAELGGEAGTVAEAEMTPPPDVSSVQTGMETPVEAAPEPAFDSYTPATPPSASSAAPDLSD